MPLSEEELRLLEQMERALSEEDPKFASTLRGTSLRRVARRRAMLAGAVFALGIVVLMTGAISQIWAIGIVGFVVMLGSATFGLNALRNQAQAGPAAETGAPHADQGSRAFTVIDGGRRTRSRQRRSGAGGAGFMDRMEERWRRRREENGGF
ncbi:hypothetical protein NOK12_06940 [Nocardioides sp. OK12]|uniref:DUF3040 domain-containing protein n=1 Tax=Nocardioides marinisabuli TaxID=419476 RepID=A0A7Y9JRQ7_9ACTN|nr:MULTISPECIES: DUF3040 domain-containing protein [Nocardioides]NYD58506.1 hypothetical protein [Nocardioides marinisabuli]GHJ58175.1 hypothetical protein NOK12_06940 [Nocardioides sp. OK12]